MRKLKRIISIIILITMISYTLLSCTNMSMAAQSISADISGINTSKYPGIKEMIQALQNKYPNWKFKLLYTGLDWNTVITNEYVGHGSSPRNLVYKSTNYQGAWICSICGDTHYDNGSWRCASEEAIKYMMDPRNSINETDIFQFEELTYTNADLAILKNMTKGTFLAGKENIILNAAKNNKVNAYYIVARLIQEQGTTGTVATSGAGYDGQYKGYYNAFNIAASGNSKSAILLNELAYAQKKGWTSLESSINGGIAYLASDYIAKGQNTLYLQKFDVESSGGLYSHQYMQNILAAENEGLTLKNTYSSINSISSSHTFIIPVFENMPAKACARPSTTSNSTSSKDMVKLNVNSSIRLRNAPNGGTTVGWLYKDEIVTRLEKATTKVAGTYWDKVQKSNGTVGYVARQTYDGEAFKQYLVPLATSPSTGNSSSIKLGDCNDDGNINSADALLVLKASVGMITLSKSKADVNKDGNINSTDALQILKYSVGMIKSF